MKDNAMLQKDVQNAIKFEPLLNATEIGVIVKDGIVTLTGVVNSFAKKAEAEEATKKVAGVKAVVEKIDIKFDGNWENKEDDEIAEEVLNAFKWNDKVPGEKVKVKVEKGWVTLEGEFYWNYEREAAYNAVKNLLGVKGVYNNIKLKSASSDLIEKEDIENAFKRNASLFNKDIQVKVVGHHAILTGFVDSWYQKEEAGRVAFNARGVWSVDNDLAIEYNYALVM